MSLELKNITVDAGKKKAVVDSANISLHSGELHVLLGANGSGKSSLLNGIFGHPDYILAGGSILLDGEDITSSPPEEKSKKGMFLSMQHLPEVLGITLSSFLYKSQRIISDETVFDFRKKLQSVAEKLNITAEFLDRELNVGLSGGEKKQSEMLQLVMRAPSFAFLDEIDSGVDVDALKRVFLGIEMLRKQGTGFVLVTHNTHILNEVTPDVVHIMSGGKIAASGTSKLIDTIKTKGFKGMTL